LSVQRKYPVTGSDGADANDLMKGFPTIRLITGAVCESLANDARIEKYF